MQVGILGPLEVHQATGALELRRGHPRTLLIALVLRARETITSDALIELLWGERQPRNALNALHVQVSHLRKVLASADPADAELLQTGPSGYRLQLGDHDIDAARFEALMEQARRDAAADELESALAHTTDALTLWRGDPLTDVAAEPFARGDITRLSEARLDAIELRSDLLLRMGRHNELNGELGQLVADHPLRERFHEQLMLAMYRSGRQAEALRAYDHARSVLVEELGIDPGPRLQELERAVLAQDPALDWQPPDRARPTPQLAPPAHHGPAPDDQAQVSRIPAPISPIIGREIEIERVCTLLDGNRLVTLTGPAGAGKTRLAVEVANRIAATGPVWWVDLGSIDADGLVAATVASAVGIPATAGDDLMSAITNALVAASGFLVLDTCEHVLEGAAAVAARVLTSCPDVRLLTTSRRPLGITAEIGWPVPPLAVPSRRVTDPASLARYPSVALFTARAAGVRPGFELTEANATDVAAICLSLDGLPLAIELAAGRCDALTAASIGARLQNRFDLLVGEGRGAAERQQTLRSAIDWSFDLLTSEQQGLFARLGVFPASFDLDAVEAVAGESVGDPMDQLRVLVRHSMVAVGGDDRYRLLDTLRAYALDHATLAGDAAARHAEHFRRLAEQANARIVGSDQLVWLARLRAEIPNLRTAVQWAFDQAEDELAAALVASLAWFWTLEGMLAEAAGHLERAARLEGLTPLARAKVLRGSALLAASMGQLDLARQQATASRDEARRSGDANELAHALNALAVTEWSLGDLAAAARAHDEAIAMLEGTDDHWTLGVCLALRARTALDAHDPAGLALAEAALPVARRSGDRHVVGLALDQIALHRLDQGRVGDAIRAAREGLECQEQVGYTEGRVASLHVLARALDAAGDLEGAVAAHRRALALAHRIGHVAAICEALEGLASAAAARGDLDEAARLLDAAIAERDRRDLPRRVADREPLRRLHTTVTSATGLRAGAEPLDALIVELLGEDPAGDSTPPTIP